MKNTTVFGISVSALWLTGWGTYAYFQWGDVVCMEPNEVGDFLAGISAPMALFWLVLGYFQQGTELQQNTRALLSQEKQLSIQAEETAALVKNAERQAAAAEKMALSSIEQSQRQAHLMAVEAQPILKYERTEGTERQFFLHVRNVGGTVMDMEIHSDVDGMGILIEPDKVFENAGYGVIRHDKSDHYPFMFYISYTDKLGERRTKQYSMQSTKAFKEV